MVMLPTTQIGGERPKITAPYSVLLTFGPIALGDMDEKLEGGEVRWTGQGFLEDGTVVAGVGKGTWRKDPQGHVWHTDVTTELNDGSKVRGKGVLELATLKFTGTNYSA